MASTYTNLLYHVVFSTKNRAGYIDDQLRDPLYHYIGGIIRSERGTLLEIGGMPDHVHLLTRFRADISVAEMLRVIKSNSSKWVNEQQPILDFKFGWQTGYGAFSVSESRVRDVRRYIQDQERHHRRRTFKEEFIGLLEKHGIEYDERYLWD